MDNDKVNHPSHYNTGKLEVIEIIEDQKLNYNLGNACKYLLRCGHKGNKIQDLEKCIWYLRREIELSSEEPRRPNDMKPRGCVG